MASEKEQALSHLFATLQNTEDHGLARRLENKIWYWWMQSGQEAIAQKLMRGFVMMSEGALTEAIQLFTEVIEVRPDFAEGWNKRATAYYLNGDYDASLQDIFRTLSIEKRHFGALSGLASIYLANNDYKEALRVLEYMLLICPSQPGLEEQVHELYQRLKIMKV